MLIFEAFFWVLLSVLISVIGIATYGTWKATRAIRQLPKVRDLPRLGLPPPDREPDADLYACPNRLGELEHKLAERHLAVREEITTLAARRSDIAAKASRADLARNYDQDLGLLERRSASMRRVMGQVWKTRAILHLRAHLASTARRRPDLGRLPNPADDRVDLRVASARFEVAAGTVRAYVAVIDSRRSGLPAAIPHRPEEADVEEAGLAAVESERVGADSAYADLREDMDRLADNLTWLADHSRARAVADAAPEPVDGLGGAARLLEEVETALGAVGQLVRSVDPAIAALALANLDEEITGLERAGMEARAETDAALEVERLLRPPA